MAAGEMKNGWQIRGVFLAKNMAIIISGIFRSDNY
jgi:hypothetical protein